jgi:hypothetical protein
MIYSLRNPTISGMPAVVTIYKYRNCKVVIESCALYNVVTWQNEILVVIELELQALLWINGDNTIFQLSFHTPKKKFQKWKKTF